MTESKGYQQSFSVVTAEGNIRIVTMIFDDAEHCETLETDYYDECREKVQEWLSKHFKETLADEGEDIEVSGKAASNSDIIDFRTKNG